MKKSAAAQLMRLECRVGPTVEILRSFHDRVIDGVRKFLEDYMMVGKTGARDFYGFEKDARLIEVEREIAAVHGGATIATPHKFESLRERLHTENDGAKTVISALTYLKTKHPRLTRVTQVLACFRKNKHRMRYAEWDCQGFMIASGVVEAACKTLVAQRLKLSGMRWGTLGAQATLTMRGWDQSERLDETWALADATYHCDIRVLANVINITPEPRRKERGRPSR